MPVPNFITVTKLRLFLFTLIKTAQRRRLDVPYVVTSHGKPVAKIIFYKRGTRMKEAIENFNK